jgi:hypothetical protein
MRLFHVHLPVADSAVVDANNFTHALCLRVKGGVPEKATNVFGRFVLPDVKEDQAVPLMPQRGMVKAMIQSEKSWASQPMQQRDNVSAIFHPRTTDFDANLPEVNLQDCKSMPLT